MYATNAMKIDEPTSTVEEPMKEINLGMDDDLRTIIISLNFTPKEEHALINVLKEYKDAFAWTYEDMSDLDPTLVEHQLSIKPRVKAVKQKLQRLHPKIALLTKLSWDATFESSVSQLFP